LDYDQQNFRFCPAQIVFAITHPAEDLLLRDNLRVVDREPSSSIVQTGHSKSYGKTLFEKNAEYRDAIERRLEKTGQDGKLLKAELKLMQAERELAVCRRQPVSNEKNDLSNLSEESNFALDYISKKQELTTPYPRWKASYKQHQKEKKRL
jgi:hypothetical protein